MSGPRPVLVVFSHLRWKFVYQRPQHLLSHLRRRWRVLFIEEPEQDGGRGPGWRLEEPLENLTVCRPQTSAPGHGFCAEQLQALAPMVEQLLQEQHARDLVAWFYSPLALPLAAGLHPRAIVYDCMDELSLFKNAPGELLEREEQLLQVADVVFTGGPSLYQAKKDRHHNVHCFPSSVDARHFGQAADPLPQPPDQAPLDRPRLGFFGVIDERMDLNLLAALADAPEQWPVIMLGPVVKIDPADLPRRPNLHYLGSKTYEELPAYLSGWDLCLLPFARNEATRFISPTKTLEYMAAGKPIVSTPITDVAGPYGHIVGLGDSPESFLAACRAALAEHPQQRSQRQRQMQEIIAHTSWQRTAAKMAGLIEQVLSNRPGRNLGRSAPAKVPGGGDLAPEVPSAELLAGGAETETVAAIIGAGPTGLSAAYHLGKDALLLEKNQTVGGWCRSIRENGFTFDHAGHIIFSNDPYVHQMYQMLLGDNIHWQQREAWIYSKGVYTRYPFQGSLYGLPAEVIQECIMGAIEARFGPLQLAAPAPAAPKPKGSGTCKDDAIDDCCGDGVLESTAPLGQAAGGSAAGKQAQNFEQFIYQVWGKGIARHFAIPYNRKLWAVPLVEMETSWLGGRVPLPDLQEMIEGALKPTPRPMGPNARFGYPLRGGFQAMMNGFLPHLRGKLLLGVKVVRIDPQRHLLVLADSTVVRYQHLISTMPLPLLIQQIGSEAPPAVQQAAAGLRHVSVRCVNLGIGREKLCDKHWIYYPEDTVFHRIFLQGNASPHCNAPGGFGLTCEITYAPGKPLPCDGQELIDLCIRDCKRVGIIREGDPIWAASQVDLPFAYVVYDHQRAQHVATIRQWLEQHDIILAGRYSEWEYYNSDHAFLAGKRAADIVRQKQENLSLQLAAEEPPAARTVELEQPDLAEEA